VLAAQKLKQPVVTVAGPQYPYDYNRLNSWDGSYQQSNVSAYYNAQKHAHCYPGTTTKGTYGWFMWNIRDHSGANMWLLDALHPDSQAHAWCRWQTTAKKRSRPQAAVHCLQR